MTHVLVTGSNGQLGKCLQLAFKGSQKTVVYWETRESLDICNQEQVAAYFKENAINYCVNCAAYTAVDQAESDQEAAFALNYLAVANLAKVCAKSGTVLIHPSTDYVFDGTATNPYHEEDKPKPINIYGKSKLAGELAIQEELDAYFIIRTSWLYSQFGKNFYKTIRSKLEDSQTLTVVTDQTGTPTNANDLAEFIYELIENNNQSFGLYHYSNTGAATWYDFARAIAEFLPGIDPEKVAPINEYATFAQRPAYSVLSKSKLKLVFGIEPTPWKDSLKALIAQNL